MNPRGQAGCSTSGGGCRTCPNAPKTPTDWYHSLPPATKTLLTLIFGVTLGATLLSLFFPSLAAGGGGGAGLGEESALRFDEASGMAVFGTAGSGAPFSLASLFASLALWLARTALFVPRLLFDYSPLVSISFVFDAYLFATFMAKLEVDIYGGYVVDFFDFPAGHLFTSTQLATMRDGEARRGNVLVRSLRTFWAYVQLCVALLAAYWLLCAPIHTALYYLGLVGLPEAARGSLWAALTEAARPSHVAVSTLSAVWCFLAPADTRLKLPFSNLFSSPTRTLSTGAGSGEGSGAADGSNGGQQSQSQQPPPAQASDRRQNATYASFLSSRTSVAKHGVRARHYPYAVAAIHWLMSGGSMMALLREIVAVRVVAYAYCKLLSDRDGRDKEALPRGVRDVGVRVVESLMGERSTLVRSLTAAAGQRQQEQGQEGGPAARVAAVALRCVSATRAFVHGSVLSFIPKHSLDVPRVLCRYIRRAGTTDRIGTLKEKGALTPWARY